MPKSNLLAGRRALLDGMQGHNFALPDCLQYLFERTGAFGTLDYWNFAALTGDVCAAGLRPRARGRRGILRFGVSGGAGLSVAGVRRARLCAHLCRPGRTSAASPTPSPAASRRRSTAACPCWR